MCKETTQPLFFTHKAITHYNDVIFNAMASQITSLSVVYSAVYSGADKRKHQSSASLAICEGNSPVTGEFPAQRTSNAENVSIWWRHLEKKLPWYFHTMCIDLLIRHTFYNHPAAAECPLKYNIQWPDTHESLVNCHAIASTEIPCTLMGTSSRGYVAR